MDKATFAGGCFWCLDEVFDKVEGVLSTTVGYIHGETENPTYEEVCSGKTGHIEAVELVFDPEKISFEELLDIFWHNIDPTVQNRQFCDVGRQYQTAIFTHSESQEKEALRSKANVEKKLGKVETEIHPATSFYPAENYHQKYYKKNTLRYHSYHAGSGREKRLFEVWKK